MPKAEALVGCPKSPASPFELREKQFGSLPSEGDLSRGAHRSAVGCIPSLHYPFIPSALRDLPLFFRLQDPPTDLCGERILSVVNGRRGGSQPAAFLAAGWTSWFRTSPVDNWAPLLILTPPSPHFFPTSCFYLLPTPGQWFVPIDFTAVLTFSPSSWMPYANLERRKIHMEILVNFSIFRCFTPTQNSSYRSFPSTKFS